jgi:hypothetical protein
MDVAEELVVGVVAAVPTRDLGELCDEVDTGEPLDLLEAVLDLVAQPQRGASLPLLTALHLDVRSLRRHLTAGAS